MFANHILDKGLYLKYINNFPTHQEKIIQEENSQRT